MQAKAHTLTVEEAQHLKLTNLHYHLGAEHKFVGEYDDPTESEKYDAALKDKNKLDQDKPDAGDGHRPGFMCKASSTKAGQKTPGGNGEYGKTYEFHFVYSTAGDDTLVANLGKAAGQDVTGRFQGNPMIVVQARVFVIDDSGTGASGGSASVDEDVKVPTNPVKLENAVMYTGSTTGPKYNNKCCSPYVITWHVQTTCNRISAAAFDKLVAQDNDGHMHGSRWLLDKELVVKPEGVKPLA